jgi:hypothetical protein
MNNTTYDHYIATDWAQKNMAIARMTKESNKIKVIDVPTSINEMKIYLGNLKGTKILVVEETTTSQWIYTELKDCVEKIVVCDPYRNRLLSEGAKTDKIDASKLVHLLKTGLMKEVYHSTDKFINLRRMVSGYEDLVRAGVRLKNQRYSLLRACGKEGDEKKGVKLRSITERYTLESLERQIGYYEEEKKGYKKEFKKLSKKHNEIRNQMSLPGIDIIHGVKIVARVVSANRFKKTGDYLSYTGLIKLDRISGGRSYGKKNPRCCRQLKGVYKTGTISAIGGNNEINDYYEYLIHEKRYSKHNARNRACRRLAILSLGVLRSGKKYKRRKVKDEVKKKRCR